MQPGDERYELREELGRGGTARVSRAYDRVLERFVALKVLSGPIANDPDFMSRFEREARLAARLEHPSIVTIFDFGRFADGRGFIAMRLLTGEGLEQLIARASSLGPGLVAGVISQIASALDYTHSIGMVHRDVKPNNVIVDAAGKATLTDFGIARAFDSARMTMTGLSIGTPRYMAPEQISGEEVTGASDIYSLGVVAFEMLTGRGPFRGEGTALMFKIVHEPPPLVTSVNPLLSAEVGAVIDRALAKDPADRWPSAGAFARALESAMLPAHAPASPSPSPSPSPLDLSASVSRARPDADDTLVTRAALPDKADPPAPPANSRDAAIDSPPAPPRIDPPTVVAPASAGPSAARSKGRVAGRVVLFALAALLVIGGGLGLAYAAGLIGGDDTESTEGDDADSSAVSPTEFDSLPPMVAVGAGETHTCGLTMENTLGCRGNTADGRSTAPAGYFAQLAVGKSHSCALENDGKAACWGLNDAGQSTPPAEMFTFVATGANHSCGIVKGGKATCWGSNSDGQARPPGGAFTSLALGHIHSCGILESGSVTCWGSNSKGQSTPISGPFKLITAGPGFTCGLRENGEAECWGDSVSGNPKGAFTRLSAGNGFLCGIRQAGGVVCWGSNAQGQLDAPRGEFSTVSAGWTHACAVRIDAKLLCWGTAP